MTRAKSHKFGKKTYYELDHKKHGIGGLSNMYPKKKKQDKKFKAGEMYAVVFFPQYQIPWGPAHWGGIHDIETLSKTPDLAKAKFMERLADFCTWEQYYEAGHRIRKMRISDLGDA